VNLVFFEFFRAYRFKCAEPHIESYFRSLDSSFAQPLEQLWGEMESRRRRRHGASLLRVDRLVTISIELVIVALYIRRQWNVSQTPKCIVKSCF
jgi:hypothetical protein